MGKDIKKFLLEMSIKHDCDIDHIMAGMGGKYLYVWKYREGAAHGKEFMVLEIIELL